MYGEEIVSRFHKRCECIKKEIVCSTNRRNKVGVIKPYGNIKHNLRLQYSETQYTLRKRFFICTVSDAMYKKGIKLRATLTMQIMILAIIFGKTVLLSSCTKLNPLNQFILLINSNSHILHIKKYVLKCLYKVEQFCCRRSVKLRTPINPLTVTIGRYPNAKDAMQHIRNSDQDVGSIDLPSSMHAIRRLRHFSPSKSHRSA